MDHNTQIAPDIPMLLTGLIRKALLGTDSIDPDDVSEAAMKDVISLAESQGVGAMAAESLLSLKKWAPAAEKYLREYLYSRVLYSERQSAEREKICALLEKEGTVYVPLKGEIIASLYPQAYMRRSSDVDILVEKKSLKRLSELLKEKGFELVTVSGHDHHFISERLSLELHFILEGSNMVPGAVELLESVWEHTVPRENSCRRDLTDAFCYFYTAAHIARHFMLTGGCGIRSVVDLWLLEKKTRGSAEERQSMLDKAGLAAFSRELCAFGEALFGEIRHAPDPALMEMVFAGSLFYSDEGMTLGHVARQNGKLRYMQRICFPPFDDLKYLYPVLQEKRWLYPFVVIYRLLKVFTKPGRIARRFTDIATADNDSVAKRKQLLSRLGLL